ncbi:glycosyltransferase [Microbacterium koreense]|uniref:Glycosyltransferase n=1 Tax=Microbacterium koreense TaxID=323761 RepID=A0ABW2ZU22_9MICO
MTATLRVVLDQIAAPTEPVLAEASRDLTEALIAAAPRGCEVAGIAPAGGDVAAIDGMLGLVHVRRAAVPRRELARAWQMGVTSGLGGGMIHSPTLSAPLVKHDRVHDHDQTVVTVWDLRAWEVPGEVPRGSALWQKAMLKRAVKFADAVVVPTHAFAQRLTEIAPKLTGRVRVIAGAPPSEFAVPVDEVGRRRVLGLPEQFVLMSGGDAPSDALAEGFAALAESGLDLPVVVVDTREGQEPAVVDIAAGAGVPERRVHVRGALDASDRAAVFAAAAAFVAPAQRTVFPWRVVEALALGVPIVAAESPVHRDVIVDGGAVVDRDDLGGTLAAVLASDSAAKRWGVLAADRGRVFSWREAADKVWALHADL